jgi:tRNA(Ile)-lysidine synthase
VLVGLSGGSDSVALAVILQQLAETGGFSLVGLAHVNHRLRETASRDEQFCRDLATRLGLPLQLHAADVASHAAEHGLSIEQAARRVRYAFLHRAAGDVDADRIAVGHTRDDQAETVLLKLIRGAGLTGLGGIYPRKGALVRPLMDVSRADLRTFLEEQGIGWVEDETNDELTNPRNRVRHRVIPELDRACGASSAAAIARAASVVRDDGLWLDEVAGRRYDELARRTRTGVEIEAAGLRDDPLPITRRVILRALRTIARDREVGWDHVDAALGVLTGESGGADVPGGRVELNRGKLVLIEQTPPLR